MHKGTITARQLTGANQPETLQESAGDEASNCHSERSEESLPDMQGAWHIG